MATRLVVRIHEPLLDIVKQLAADMHLLERIVHTKATNQHSRIYKIPLLPWKILERPFTFCPQLSNFRGVTHVETAPFGTLPGEVNGTTVLLGVFRIFYESLGSHSRQNRDIANW